jgi:hypothetical protein
MRRRVSTGGLKGDWNHMPPAICIYHHSTNYRKPFDSSLDNVIALEISTKRTSVDIDGTKLLEILP